MPTPFNSRRRSVVFATVLALASVTGLWAELWFGPEHLRWRPAYSASTLAALFFAGIVLAFGAVAAASVLWRRALQATAVLCLGGMVLPVQVASLLPPPTYTYRHEERLVTVRGTPAIERGRYGIAYLVLPPPEPADAPIRIMVGPFASKFTRGHALTFTIWRTREVLRPNWRVKGEVPQWSDTLETVRDGDDTFYDARICRVHHVMMQRIELPIHYGDQLFHDPAWAEFSGGPGFIIGGDMFAGRTGIGYRCPICAKLYQEWLVKYRQTRRQ